MKKIINKIKSYFKKLLFKQDYNSIQQLIDMYQPLDYYKGYDLNMPMLDQQLNTVQLQQLSTKFIEDVITLFVQRYYLGDYFQKYNSIMFIPSIITINYINDCFNHEINLKKYNELLRLNTLAKNELFSVVLTLINQWIYKLNENDEEEIHE